MTDLAEIVQRLQKLEEIEAIKQLKYRYWRHLDLKQWDELRELFVETATVNYGSGRYEFAGREAIMKFLADSLSEERGSVTIHHGHHPEIEIGGPRTASGRWALYNYLYNVKQNRAVRIGAYYHDEYEKVGADWKFRHIGYQNIFHEEWARDSLPSKLLIG